jgi:hypothetical protein
MNKILHSKDDDDDIELGFNYNLVVESISNTQIGESEDLFGIINF